MLEFLALLTLAGIGLSILALFLVVGFFLKLTLRLLLLPLAIVGGLFKLLGLVIVTILGLVLAPVLFAIFLVLALPALVLLGLFGLGWAAAAA